MTHEYFINNSLMPGQGRIQDLFIGGWRLRAKRETSEASKKQLGVGGKF